MDPTLLLLLMKMFNMWSVCIQGYIVFNPFPLGTGGGVEKYNDKKNVNNYKKNVKNNEKMLHSYGFSGKIFFL